MLMSINFIKKKGVGVKDKILATKAFLISTLLLKEVISSNWVKE